MQTLLFSATMPAWVRDMQAKYLNPGSVHIDLVGNDAMKASRSVAHKVLYAHWSQRADIIRDLIACYGFSGAPPPPLPPPPPCVLLSGVCSPVVSTGVR